MPKDKKFVNPLTRPSGKGESMYTNTYTETSTSTDVDTSTETFEGKQKKKKQTFEQTHERLTAWVDKRLKQNFEKLAEIEEVSKTALLNEALTDLIEKYQNR